MKWYFNASETEQEIFREWFYGVMCMHEVEIDFIKKNGEARTITCTLDEGKMLGYVPKSDNVRAKSKESLSVYDLEKEEWRAFRYDSITCIKFNI